MSEPNEPNLLPCPFCGATTEQTASIVHDGKYPVISMDCNEILSDEDKPSRYPWIITCTNCGIRTSHWKTKMEAIKDWNRRAAPKWTTEPPKEEGLYISKNREDGIDVFHRIGRNNLIGWTENCKVLWFKIELPPLPEGKQWTDGYGEPSFARVARRCGKVIE